MSKIDMLFPTPVYSAYVSKESFGSIQDDFDNAYNDLKSKDAFQYVPGWNSHKISDISFKTSLVEQYQLDNFKTELRRHVLSYLNKIGSYVGSTYPANYKVYSSWMTLYGKEDFAHKHTHGCADIAGVYYYKTSGMDGSLRLDSPNKLVHSSYCFVHMPPTVGYTPDVGKIILFPGWLEHGVGYNPTDEERVSVSFNLMFEREFC